MSDDIAEKREKLRLATRDICDSASDAEVIMDCADAYALAVLEAAGKHKHYHNEACVSGEARWCPVFALRARIGPEAGTPAEAGE